MARIVFAVCLLLLPSLAHAEKRLALLVGNQGYASEIGPLANPHNDIALLGRALKSLGFEVASVRDAGLADLHQAVNAYARRVRAAGPNAVGFFYYAGHGASDSGTNYLIPVDVTSAEEGALWDRSLRVTEITRKLKAEAGNAAHFVVIDACRNNLKLRKAGSRAHVQSRGLMRVAEEAGMLIAYATAEGELAADAGVGSGPYAKVLAEEIVKPGVEAVTMFRRVQVRVRAAIGQEPWLGFSALGEVYMGGPSPAPVKAADGAATETATRLSEAAEAWDRTKDTTSIAVLEVFISRYKDSYYAELARARIEELKRIEEPNRKKVAVVPHLPPPTVVKPAEPTALIVPAPTTRAPDRIRFGYSITQSGPLGPGAESTSISQYRLWQKRVNDAGGILLKKFNKKVPIDLIGYDDQGKPDELLKLTERLIVQDKVDMILSPYATHMNLASAPIINKYQYPVILSTSAAALLYELAPQLPYAFWHLVQPKEATRPLSAMIAGLKKEGKLKGRVAVIHPSVQLGVELHSAFTEAAKKDGLEIVFSKSYPFGASDLQPLIREVMASNPDAFIAFSYPPDTFMLTEQCQIVGFNPQMMYLAIGTNFPTFKQKFGNKVNGILMHGGINPSQPGLDAYYKAHRAMFNRESEAGAVSVYSALEVTQQAIEAVGEIDRPKIRDAIANGTFQTIWGEITYRSQLNVDPWAVAQWQNGDVVGLFPANKRGARPLQFPKPAWR